MFPKGEAAADRAKRKADLRALDRKESRAVKLRSDGQCEVVFSDTGGRCSRRATEVHHMLGRGREAGPWMKPEYKQHVCAGPTGHHLMITGDIGGKRLKLVQEGDVPLWTDRYERVRSDPT